MTLLPGAFLEVDRHPRIRPHIGRPVHAGPSVQPVSAGAPGQYVVTFVTLQNIVAITAVQPVCARAALKNVIAAIAAQFIIPTFSFKGVGKVIPDQQISVSGTFQAFDTDEDIAQGMTFLTRAIAEVYRYARIRPQVGGRVQTSAPVQPVGT